jgi:uncharacterized protein
LVKISSDYNAILNKTARYVEDALSRETTGHDWQHIRRVWHNACVIAGNEDVDSLRVELAALLHDLDDWKLTGGQPGDWPQRANAIMQALEIDSDLRNDVATVIQSIDFKGTEAAQDTLSQEAQVVHDADKLDAIGAVGIARCFAFNGANGRPLFNPELFPADALDEAAYTNLERERNTAINHFFDKLLHLQQRMQTSTGREMAENRHAFLVTYLREFFAETGEEAWKDYLDSFVGTSV